MEQWKCHYDWSVESKVYKKFCLLESCVSLPAFSPYSALSHEFSQKMSSKSYVFPLPIMMKNESKHEDCMAIMDSYEEQLISLYGQAFGTVPLFAILYATM